MPEIITAQEPLAHLLMDLYDNGEHEVDLSIMAERIVDISDICEETIPGLGQIVIKYGSAKRGLIAQIQDRHEFGKDTGSGMHLFPDELGVAGMITADYFIHRARELGCDVMELAETIVGFAPRDDLGN